MITGLVHLLWRLLLLPFKLALALLGTTFRVGARVGSAPARVTWAATRRAGWTGTSCFALGVAAGLLVAPTSGAALRARLAAENYFDGDLENPEFDRTLADAVRRYQETHQLDVNGTLTAETRSSLNTSAERRYAQIHMALDKWRETALAADAGGEYVWVNIPDF